jgi:hypothetical protein
MRPASPQAGGDWLRLALSLSVWRWAAAGAAAARGGGARRARFSPRPAAPDAAPVLTTTM